MIKYYTYYVINGEQILRRFSVTAPELISMIDFDNDTKKYREKNVFYVYIKIKSIKI